MEDRRAEVKSKLRSLVSNRDEFLHQRRQQQQQLDMTSCCMPHPASSTVALVDQLIIGIVNDTIDTVTALVVADHCSSELHDTMLNVLDLVSTLLQQNSRNCSDRALMHAATPTRTCSDLVVAFLLTFCIVVMWLVEIWSAISPSSCPVP